MVTKINALGLQELQSVAGKRTYKIQWEQEKISIHGNINININIHIDVGGISIDPDCIFKGVIELLIDGKIVKYGYLPVQCMLKSGEYLEYYSAGCNFDYIQYISNASELEVRVVLYNIHELAYVDLTKVPSVEVSNNQPCVVDRIISSMTIAELC